MLKRMVHGRGREETPLVGTYVHPMALHTLVQRANHLIECAQREGAENGGGFDVRWLVVSLLWYRF